MDKPSKVGFSLQDAVNTNITISMAKVAMYGLVMEAIETAIPLDNLKVVHVEDTLRILINSKVSLWRVTKIR